MLTSTLSSVISKAQFFDSILTPSKPTSISSETLSEFVFIAILVSVLSTPSALLSFTLPS